MKQILDITFSGFWPFVGMWILIYAFLNTIRFLWNRFWRHLNIRKWGYPFPHCDADGDFKKIEETQG